LSLFFLFLFSPFALSAGFGRVRCGVFSAGESH
jgi:hypothetical protein